MANEYTFLQIRQLDEQVSRWRAPAASPAPRMGWIRSIRQALGMTTGQVAARLGASQPRVVKLEQAELDGSVTLASMHKAAHALGCKFVYAFVPHEPLETMLEKQAARVARREVESVSHSMSLENQWVRRKTEARQLKVLREKLLEGPHRRLWK